MSSDPKPGDKGFVYPHGRMGKPGKRPPLHQIIKASFAFIMWVVCMMLGASTDDRQLLVTFTIACILFFGTAFSYPARAMDQKSDDEDETGGHGL